MGFVSKISSSVTHKYIWVPNTMLSFRKKLMNQFQENSRTDRRTDRQTLFYRILQVEARGPITVYNQKMLLVSGSLRR